MTYHKSDFHYDLPDERIARYPLPERSAARMLVARVLDADTVELGDHQVRDLPDCLDPADLLVFNNTRVLPARLYGHKASGGKIEILIERLKSPHEASAYIRAPKSPQAGSTLYVGDATLRVGDRDDALFTLYSDVSPWQELLAAHGEMPIPPYLERRAQDSDSERYQTVYAKHSGAVAAPTAGLHFTPELLDQLQANGIRRAEVTLHVGAGTFQPVRSENIAEHKMHKEWYSIPAETVEAIAETKANGKRVWAVGTTSVRSLEAAAQSGRLQAGEGDTDIFITPGYRFQVADGLITNFHLPKSTLLMLVSAFSGVEHIRAAYRHAIEQQYRFFSYGDAMLLTRAEAT